MKDKEKRNIWRLFLESGVQFFGKDENGKDIFYPWGKPGEAFYVKKKQIIHIYLFNLFILILLSIGLSNKDIYELQSIFSANVWEDIVTLIAALIFAIYIVGMHIFRKNKTLYVLPKDRRPPRKAIGCLWLWLCFILMQLHGMWIALENKSLLILIFYSIDVLCISYFLMKIWRTRGYYFAGRD